MMSGVEALCGGTRCRVELRQGAAEMKLREDGVDHKVESSDESLTRIPSTFLTSPMLAHVHIVLGFFFFSGRVACGNLRSPTED